MDGFTVGSIITANEKRHHRCRYVNVYNWGLVVAWEIVSGRGFEYNQRDQIGRILKVLGPNFISKVVKKFGDFWTY